MAGCLDHSTQTIIGSDVSAAVVEAANQNARYAGARGIRFQVSDALALDFSKLAPPHAKGLIVSNLPYGKRLGTPSSARSLIEDFCERVAHAARGWDFALLTPRELPIRHPGLIVDNEFALINSGVPVTFTLGHVPT